MALFSVVVSFNNKKRAFAETLFYYPCIASESCQGFRESCDLRNLIRCCLSWAAQSPIFNPNNGVHYRSWPWPRWDASAVQRWWRAPRLPQPGSCSILQPPPTGLRCGVVGIVSFVARQYNLWRRLCLEAERSARTRQAQPFVTGHSEGATNRHWLESVIPQPNHQDNVKVLTL